MHYTMRQQLKWVFQIAFKIFYMYSVRKAESVSKVR